MKAKTQSPAHPPIISVASVSLWWVFASSAMTGPSGFTVSDLRLLIRYSVSAYHTSVRVCRQLKFRQLRAFIWTGIDVNKLLSYRRLHGFGSVIPAQAGIQVPQLRREIRYEERPVKPPMNADGDSVIPAEAGIRVSSTTNGTDIRVMDVIRCWPSILPGLGLLFPSFRFHLPAFPPVAAGGPRPPWHFVSFGFAFPLACAYN